MNNNCPAPGHEGRPPLYVTWLTFSAKRPFIRGGRQRLCDHPIHVEHFEMFIAGQDTCDNESGFAWTWLSCRERRVLVKTPAYQLCQMHVQRVANAMRWVAATERS